MDHLLLMINHVFITSDLQPYLPENT